MIKECWCELKGLPKPAWEEIWEGPLEPRIELLKVKMRQYEEKAQKMKVEYDKQQAILKEKEEARKQKAAAAKEAKDKEKSGKKTTTKIEELAPRTPATSEAKGQLQMSS